MDRRLFLSLAALAATPGLAHAAGGGGDKKKSGGGTYMPIDTLLGTTIRNDGRRGVLSVDCGLDIPNEALRTRAQQSLPRLRAAYLQAVQSYSSGLSTGQLPNPDYIGQALQRQTDLILGKPGARVLLGSIVVN
ncbi:MAG: Tat pathway signal protein [Phenylobacterium zucineum]|nr:MAG: Tat pathway signal protein [Phenylobacterium zucineum]